MRLLLLKQDEISLLEECLDRIDANEDRELFLVLYAGRNGSD
jgi:hypothetical protein